MLRYGTAFITFLLWDYITTVGTRLVVDKSVWAVLLSAITTVFWVYGIRLSVEKSGVVPFIVVGALVGTWLGISFPP